MAPLVDGRLQGAGNPVCGSLAFDLPFLSLCDTPAFMVGPEAEKPAIVRHVARMFVIGASLTGPIFTIVLRTGYGLGAQAMAGRRLPRALLHDRVADRQIQRNGP